MIGAHAVVSKDVPPYGIAVGNPAKVAKIRFDPVTVERLQRVAWWNWDQSKLEELLPLLMNNDIEAFLHAGEQEQYFGENINHPDKDS